MNKITHTNLFREKKFSSLPVGFIGIDVNFNNGRGIPYLQVKSSISRTTSTKFGT